MATSRSSRADSFAGPPGPGTSGHFDADGHRLYWELHGAAEAPPVILLHHGLGSVRAWRAQIPAMVRAGYRVLAYDRWGYGRSAARPGLDAPSFRTDLDDLSALMNDLGLTRAALVGHSDGGTIALYFAAVQPAGAARIVVVAAHVYVEASMVPGLQGIARQFEDDERFLKGLRLAHGDKAEAVFRNWHDEWVRPEHSAWDMRPALAQVACPTLVVQGEADEHATPQHARDIASGVRDGTLWLIPGIGHMVPQDAAPGFNARLVDFLEPWRREFQP